MAAHNDAAHIMRTAQKSCLLNNVLEFHSGLPLITPKAIAPIELIGLVTVLLAPKARAVTSANGFTPVETAMSGIVGTMDGRMTPVVEDTIANRLPIIEYKGFTVNRFIKTFRAFVRSSIPPATFTIPISMLMPEIRITEDQGTVAITFFSSAQPRSSSTAATRNADKPMSKPATMDNKMNAPRPTRDKICLPFSFGISSALVLGHRSSFHPLNTTYTKIKEQVASATAWGSWLGYFFEMFAEKEHKAVFAVIPTMDIKPEQKRSTWMQRHFNICIGGTCDLMDGLSNKYQCTEKVLKDFWKYTPLYRASSCYTVRKGGGDWNQDTYKKYKENGMLERCTPYWERMERFANVADADLDKLYEQEIEAEKKEFERLCCKSIKEIKNMSRGQSLWIYGAGTGGKSET